MNKALITATVASMIDNFNMPNIKLLLELGYEVTVACNFEKGNTITDEKIKELKNKLDYLGVYWIQVDFDRSPFSSKTYHAYKQLKSIIDENDYQIIHTHAPVSSILTRLASKKARKNGTRVIYTAHGFHFFKGSSLASWLLYYPLEVYCSRFTDVLLTINKEDYALAKQKMKSKSVLYIPGIGVKTGGCTLENTFKIEKRKELGINSNAILLLSVGELNKNKNHKVVINAMNRMKNSNVEYMIAGRGEKKKELEQLIEEYGLTKRVHLLGYRSDISDLYSVSDIYIHPSYREGLSVALMEAMASRLPCIVSKIRGNTDLIIHGSGGYQVNPDDVKTFDRFISILSNDNELRDAYGNYNHEQIEKFSITNVMKETKIIYENCSNR